ncbi:MAG TPA: prephenate dehydrogenase/arogenate dehydrogenase family protein [Coriobacteriia bacterium]|nr:prephenate dehydrogenase/arogenate dehydrogenase family protein [Coriobacteriia bacterium]
MSFSTVVVVGVGLIGGSFAAALKRLEPAPRVYGIDTEPAALDWAVAHGILDAGAVPGTSGASEWLGPHGGELVVLATPAARVVEWIEHLGRSGFGGVVTDVASTKTGIIRAAERHLSGSARFVGGHPMAGSERSGVEAADAALFQGAYYVLTPTPETDLAAYREVHALVSALGCRVVSVAPEEHDEAVAVVSHVPHVAASALVSVAVARAGNDGELLRLAAGGFKDTTRVAAGSPELWTGICMDNAAAVSDGVDELRRTLGDFVTMLRHGDANAVQSWLARAADVRRSLPAQWVPATTALTEVSVPMVDRPGVIAQITTAASRAGCNIEAIEIEHLSESSARLVMVLTDEGDIARFIDEVRAAGHAPQVRPLDAVGE